MILEPYISVTVDPLFPMTQLHRTYGLVYHAVSRRSRTNVAIKVLSIQKNHQADIDNYEKEINFLQDGFTCKYIVQLLETYRFENEVCH